MDKLDAVLNRYPSFYNKSSQDSKIRTIVNAVVQELKLANGMITMLDGMIGIDSTTGEELDIRWGGLLNLPRQTDEADDMYRNRMKTTMASMVGGTETAIKYAVAVALELTDASIIDARIQVMDSWEYSGGIPITIGNGRSVCLVDLNYGLYDYSTDIFSVVRKAIKYAKASGVDVQLIMINYRIMTYYELASMSYVDLESLQYGQLGGGA